MGTPQTEWPAIAREPANTTTLLTRHVAILALIPPLAQFVGGSLTDTDANERLSRYAEAIRRIGPQFCILSSDLGQKNNPLPVDGYAAFLQAMRTRGFTERDVTMMSKENPAKLLGLR